MLKYLTIVLFSIGFNLCVCIAQEVQNFYTGSDGIRVFLPLGKISFADSIVALRMGYPRPVSRLRDSSQCLHKPNYKSYQSPDFFSLGCSGEVVVKFTNNGFMNLKGDDLYVFEVGPSKESASVEISTNGEDWVYAGIASGGTSKLEFDDKQIDSTSIFYYIRLKDLKDECSGRSAGADIDAIGAINSVIKLTVNADVLFDVDMFKLKESADTTLEALATTIRQVGKATILVEGHTDSDASEEYNLKLSENRCHTVVDRISTLLGYETSYNYMIKAHGEGKPKVKNDSEKNKQINRRVEITVLPPLDYYESIRN